MDLFNNPIAFIFSAVSLIIAITIHEFSHAFAAEHLGDPTPRLMGRLTLNPLAHLDPLGTLLLIIAHFGWGKPVTFDPFNLRNPRRDSAIISLAGPASNIILATVCSLLMRLFIAVTPENPASTVGVVGIMIVISILRSLITFNVVLAIFNLVPVHPLDGFNVVKGLLPEDQSREWAQLERFGMIFLLILVFFPGNPLSRLISPVIEFFLNLFLPRSGLV
ncbi:site-2 protease family protein [Candidatus Gottesmanbacteria bacterium]|nr:site-2 protease family protein [Candidatus Gottesmanbacteria bacterium]